MKEEIRNLIGRWRYAGVFKKKILIALITSRYLEMIEMCSSNERNEILDQLLFISQSYSTLQEQS